MMTAALSPPAECPSVMRNMRPWRHNHTNTIMGKWSVSRDEMPRRVHPDFCPGWLYVTTPKVHHHHVVYNLRRVRPDFCPGWLYVTTPKVYTTTMLSMTCVEFIQNSGQAGSMSLHQSPNVHHHPDFA